jgi:hypothetical protein
LDSDGSTAYDEPYGKPKGEKTGFRAIQTPADFKLEGFPKDEQT